MWRLQSWTQGGHPQGQQSTMQSWAFCPAVQRDGGNEMGRPIKPAPLCSHSGTPILWASPPVVLPSHLLLPRW